MKVVLLSLLAVIVLHNSSQATIRRVGFFASPVSGTDYSTFTLAYNAATAGDTILVFPGIPAITQTFTKKLTVIGPGSWLDPTSTPKGNAALQAFAGTVTISNLTYNAGSEGSVIMGLEGGTIFVNTGNITIRRNRELQIYLVGVTTVITISNIQILENYRVAVNSYYANGSSVTNLNVSNNFISNFGTAALNTYSGNISNNVWAYEATLTAPANGGPSAMSTTNGIELGGGAYLFQNNILMSYTNAAAASNYNYFVFSNGANTVFNYNLSVQSTAAQNWGVGVGNISLTPANAALVFDGFPAIGAFSADARYKLKANSAALIANRPGSTADAGMFGGTTPYKLGMVPSIPSIYLFTSPQGNNPTGNTIQLNVSTRGNN